VQEHERAVGGWHAEAPVLAAVVQATGAALAALSDVAEHLTVFPTRMRENLERTNGVVFSERVMLQLAPVLGRDEAQRLVSDAVARCGYGGSRFGEVVRTTPEIARALPADVLASVDSPEAYLGEAETLRLALLSDAR
jgi:3-carboxy-cis,cis-muconate cycloisomerase